MSVLDVPRKDKAMTMVDRLSGSYNKCLPSHVTLEAFDRALLTSFRKTPKLLDCDPKSLAAAVITSAQLGLVIGLNGSCWLIPFKNECQLVIGYQGLVDLCYRSGRVESISAEVVCENDIFEFEQGLNPQLRHIPSLRSDRGTPYAVYAIASIKGSSRPVYVVLSKAEVMQVRDSSAGAKRSDSPWNGQFFAEMWKKTAVRRIVKYLPKSVELDRAIEYENRQDERWAAAKDVSDPFSAGRGSIYRREEAPSANDDMQAGDDEWNIEAEERAAIQAEAATT